jgi:hypothetical protein
MCYIICTNKLSKRYFNMCQTKIIYIYIYIYMHVHAHTHTHNNYVLFISDMLKNI